MANTKKTRQEWLDQAIVLLMAEFKPEGLKLPKYRATIGLPSSGAFGIAKRTIGQCFYPECSTDKTTEIMISPTQDKPLDILEVTAHEMVHATLGAGFGHGPKFKKLANSIGLVGKMTATEAGPDFVKRTKTILKELGPLAHKLNVLTIIVEWFSERQINGLYLRISGGNAKQIILLIAQFAPRPLI